MIDPAIFIPMMRYAVETATPSVAELLVVWKDRISDAKEEYRNRPSETLMDAVENKRRVCLNQIGELQTRAILEVTDKSLLQKVSIMLFELTAETYETNIEQELDLVQRRADQIKSVLDRDQKDRKFRKIVRFVAVIISVLIFISLFTAAVLSPLYLSTIDYTIPILSIPLPILMWSAIGSFTALLYRFNKAEEAEIHDPLRLIVTRPLTGIMMGVVTYLVVKTGFLAMQ
jgi:hypothetical protein